MHFCASSHAITAQVQPFERKDDFMSKQSFFKKALTGFISTAMLASSVPYVSAPVSASTSHNYAEALELSLYFYDANQCGSEVDDNCLTWRGNCHTYDATASLDSATGLSSDAKAVIQAQNGGSSTVDVSGGYHDAGDHIKFNLTMGFNGASLGWAYYDHPEAFKDTGTEDHLFYILRETADFMMKTTYLNDSGEVAAICHTVSNSGDHNYWQPPEVQNYDRPTYWFSGSTINNHVCNLMAASLASTATVLKESDPDYAAECFKYADAIYKYSCKYSGYESSGFGDMYQSGNMAPASSKAWAEVWLYLADSSTYPLPTTKPTGNANYNGEYDGWIYSWGKVWGAYACLMNDLTGDSAFLNEVKYNTDQKNASQYIVYSDWGSTRYNCAWQTYAITYGEAANDSSYLEKAKWQMDYILGDNPTGYSFVVGYGDKWPTHIHHRAANPGRGSATVNGSADDNTEAKYTLYGALIGGPSDSNGTYNDATNSYAHTEMALDYNACLVPALAGLYANYGGDTTAAKTTIANASEIDENFVFGSGEVVVDCKTQLEYDNSPMTVGETRAIRFYHSDELTGSMAHISEVSSNISYTYEEGSDTIYITALEAGTATMYIQDTNCAFGDYATIEIKEPETTEPTTEEPTTEPTTEAPSDVEYGDANVDGEVDINDAVLIMSHMANQNAYPITAQGITNGDVYQQGDGISLGDANSIQKYLAKMIKTLPES